MRIRRTIKMTAVILHAMMVMVMTDDVGENGDEA